MRFVAWVLSMAVGLVALAELLWRQDHAALQPDAWSTGPSKVAEVRRAPGDGEGAPRGVGVYVRPAWLPLGVAGAQLAFAGYCTSIHTRWLADDLLQVNCELSPKGGEPWVAQRPVQRTKVKVVLVRRQEIAFARHG